MKAFNEQAHFFIAVPLPAQIQSYLWEQSQKLKEILPYKNWTQEADFHITCYFIGGTTPSVIHQIDGDLKGIPNTVSSFSLELNDFGFFGKPTQPRVLWVGIKQQSQLFQCQAFVESQVKKAGLPVEKRPYRPHITLAKRWNGTDNINVLAELPKLDKESPLSWKVEDIVLYQINTGQNPKYEPIARYPLG